MLRAMHCGRVRALYTAQIYQDWLRYTLREEWLCRTERWVGRTKINIRLTPTLRSTSVGLTKIHWLISMSDWPKLTEIYVGLTEIDWDLCRIDRDWPRSYVSQIDQDRLRSTSVRLTIIDLDPRQSEWPGLTEIHINQMDRDLCRNDRDWLRSNVGLTEIDWDV